MRYFIYLSYNGLRYSGWQVQPNTETVQETIERALETILRTPCPIVGAGRTDAGVHARVMVAHADIALELSEIGTLKHKLNRLLPPDISIQKNCSCFRRGSRSLLCCLTYLPLLCHGTERPIHGASSVQVASSSRCGGYE